LAQCVFSGSGVPSTDTGTRILTYAESSYEDDETPASAGTMSYGTIRRMAATARPIVRITGADLTNIVTSTAVQTDEPVRVTSDIILKMPAST